MPMPNEIGHQVRFQKSLVGLFKKAWWHIPEIMASSMLAMIGLGLGVAGAINYIKNDGDNREYKRMFIIMRPDDPRTSRLRNPVCTKY